jgi:hypothetical protein
VPAAISDDVLRKVALFRSRGRIPSCIWMHSNQSVLVRSSQPMVGVKRMRCVEDEMLLSAILEANPNNSKALYIIDSRPKVCIHSQ